MRFRSAGTGAERDLQGSLLRLSKLMEMRVSFWQEQPHVISALSLSSWTLAH